MNHYAVEQAGLIMNSAETEKRPSMCSEAGSMFPIFNDSWHGNCFRRTNNGEPVPVSDGGGLPNKVHLTPLSQNAGVTTMSESALRVFMSPKMTIRKASGESDFSC